MHILFQSSRTRHIGALFLFLPLLFLFMPGEEDIYPPSPDPYTEQAYVLHATGTLGFIDENGWVEPSMSRAPLFPAFLAAWMNVDEAFRDGSRCWAMAQSKSERRNCVMDYGFIHYVQVVLFWVGAVAVWGAGRLMFAHPMAAYATVAVYTVSGEIFEYATIHRVSENLSTPLICIASLALLFGWRKKKPAWFFAAGIFIGASALVRPANQFLIFLIPAAILAHAVLRSGAWRKEVLALCLAVFVGGFGVITGPWAMRNVLLFDKVAIASGESPVLAIRYSYNQMRWDEALASFVYWLPDFGDELTPVLFDEKSYERLVQSAPDGFRQTGYRLTATLKQQGKDVSRTLIGMIIDDWPRHILVSIPIIWRGLFIGKYVSLLLIPALFAMFVFARGRKWDDLFYLAMPGIALLIFYGLITHNIPRYGMTLMPAASVAFVMACLSVIGARARGETEE